MEIYLYKVGTNYSGGLTALTLALSPKEREHAKAACSKPLNGELESCE
jgi:hypothetical protein